MFAQFALALALVSCLSIQIAEAEEPRRVPVFPVLKQGGFPNPNAPARGRHLSDLGFSGRSASVIIHRPDAGPGLDDRITAFLERSGCAKAVRLGPQWVLPTWRLHAKPCRYSEDILFTDGVFVLVLSRIDYAAQDYEQANAPRVVTETALGRALKRLGAINGDRL